MTTPDLTPEQMLATTPERYLVHGWTDANGRPHAYLTGTVAMAACTQLREAQVSPQELNAVLEGYKLVLPYYGEDPSARIVMATEEVLALVTGMIAQPVNPGLLAWLEPCVLAVKSPGDLRAFAVHLQAVAQRYAVLVNMPTAP